MNNNDRRGNKPADIQYRRMFGNFLRDSKASRTAQVEFKSACLYPTSQRKLKRYKLRILAQHLVLLGCLALFSLVLLRVFTLFS